MFATNLGADCLFIYMCTGRLAVPVVVWVACSTHFFMAKTFLTYCLIKIFKSMIILAFAVAFVAILRFVTAVIGGITTAPDITYYLCRPFFFAQSMKWGFVCWLCLFAATGWAINFIVNYFV